jgi:hypothetical protein
MSAVSHLLHKPKLMCRTTTVLSSGSILPVLDLLLLRLGTGFVISVIRALRRVVNPRGRLLDEGPRRAQEGEAVEGRLDKHSRWDRYYSREKRENR